MNFVLLTAAVTPAAQFKAALSDPSARLAQYQSAVANWVEGTTQQEWQILVVETTGCSLSAIAAKVDSSMRHRVTLIPFLPSDEAMSRGKGSVEAAAIDHVILSGEVGAADNATIYKATGRLHLLNMRQLLTPIPDNTAVVRRSLDGKYCDTRFFGTTVSFWRKYLTGMHREVNDGEGRYIEHVLARRLREAEYWERTQICRFPSRPHISGISGTRGTKYGRPGASQMGSFLRPLESLLASRITTKQV